MYLYCLMILFKQDYAEQIANHKRKLNYCSHKRKLNYLPWSECNYNAPQYICGCIYILVVGD